MNHFTSSFNPASPEATAISQLFAVTLVVCALIFAVVIGIIAFGLMRFRWREGGDQSEPSQVAGNRKVEIVWTVIPFLIVIMLFALTARTMSSSDPSPAPKPDLIVVGHQWWWEARYPHSGVIAANEIHIPVGRPLCLELQSADVLHEFWVVQLARKMTTVPGRPNYIWLQADQPGTYLGVCSEYCGTQHAWMRFLVVAEEASAFEQWQQVQLKAAGAPAEGSAAQGLALIKQMTCSNCHAIHGTGIDAHVGPDLTHFAGRRELGAGVAANTDANLRRWLANPHAVKPGVYMPSFKFTDEQLSNLVAYLETLK